MLASGGRGHVRVCGPASGCGRARRRPTRADGGKSPQLRLNPPLVLTPRDRARTHGSEVVRPEAVSARSLRAFSPHRRACSAASEIVRSRARVGRASASLRGERACPRGLRRGTGVERDRIERVGSKAASEIVPPSRASGARQRRSDASEHARGDASRPPASSAIASSASVRRRLECVRVVQRSVPERPTPRIRRARSRDPEVRAGGRRLRHMGPRGIRTGAAPRSRDHGPHARRAAPRR